MEADWSVEIGAEHPSIDVPWRDISSGLKFIDLRGLPGSIQDIAEARQYPALGAALSILNGDDSQVFTSKCDAWPVAGDELDALDLGVDRSDAQFGVAAYIDVVLREAIDFASFEVHQRWLRRLISDLRAITLQCALVEFTLRWAQVEDNEGFATTLHITACGADEASALRTWEIALATTVALVARGAAAADLPAQPSSISGK